MNGTPLKAALWARVSTSSQTTENQLLVLRQWAADCGMEIVREFVTEDSAWAGAKASNGKGQEFERQRNEMLAGVRGGQYQVILLWAIDRLSRRGSEDMQRYLRLLAEAGADVRSKQDTWLNTADGLARELLIGVFSTLAKFESERRSERIKAGLARRKAEGKPVGGGHVGAKDRRPRQREGYTAAWAPGGKRRQAEEERKAAE